MRDYQHFVRREIVILANDHYSADIIGLPQGLMRAITLWGVMKLYWTSGQVSSGHRSLIGNFPPALQARNVIILANARENFFLIIILTPVHLYNK